MAEQLGLFARWYLARSAEDAGRKGEGYIVLATDENEARRSCRADYGFDPVELELETEIPHGW